MDLRRLRQFLAVAEAGSITRAAERIGMQQPPLTQAMRALEADLGVPLLRRQARGVRLTEAGRALADDVRVILAQLDRAAETVRRVARGEEGRIAIGFTSSAPFHPFVPRLIRAFRDALPRVSLQLEEAGSADLIAALRAERIDAALVRSAVADPAGLMVRPLVQEPMVVAVPAGHALAAADAPVVLRDLAAETFIVYRRSSGPGLYDAILAACHAAGFSPRIGQEAPRIVATLNLVAAGLGIALVPESLRRMQLDGVICRPIAEPNGPVAPILLATRLGDGMPAVQRLLALVRGMAPAA